MERRLILAPGEHSPIEPGVYLPAGSVVVVGDRDTLPLFKAAGARVAEASNEEDALKAVREAAASGGAAVIIVLKHVIGDEESFREKVRGLGVPVLILPTRWAEARPVDVNRLIARALGIG